MLNIKLLIQILKNQNHILHELGSMHSSGKIHTGTYCKDTISEKLRKDTYKLIKRLDSI